jgi:hypothetical protein
MKLYTDVQSQQLGGYAAAGNKDPMGLNPDSLPSQEQIGGNGTAMAPYLAVPGAGC